MEGCKASCFAKCAKLGHWPFYWILISLQLQIVLQPFGQLNIQQKERGDAEQKKEARGPPFAFHTYVFISVIRWTCTQWRGLFQNMACQYLLHFIHIYVLIEFFLYRYRITANPQLQFGVKVETFTGLNAEFRDFAIRY